MSFKSRLADAIRSFVLAMKARPEDPKLDVRHIHIGPDDVVVFTYEGRLSLSQINAIKEQWGMLNSKNRAMVLDGGMTISAINLGAIVESQNALAH